MSIDPVAIATQAAQDFGVDPQLAVNVLYQESSGRHYNDDGSVVTSPAGAMGYMGLKPDTAKSLGVDPADPVQNIRGGVQYLAQNIAKFGSPELGVAAYNAGPGKVQRFGGVPPYRETRQYVSDVLPGSGGAPAPAAAAPDPSDPANWSDSAAPAPQGSAAPTAAQPDPSDPANWSDPAPVQQTSKIGDSGGQTTFATDGTMRDPRTGKPFNDDVQRTYRILRPLIDQKAGAGAANNPYATANATDVDAVPNGAFYVDGTQPGAPIWKKGDPDGLNKARDQELRNTATGRSDSFTPLSDFGQSATAPFNAIMAGGIAGLGQAASNSVGHLAAMVGLGGSDWNAINPNQRAEAAYEAERAGQRVSDDTDPVMSSLGRLGGGLAVGAPGASAVPALARGGFEAGLDAVNGATHAAGAKFWPTVGQIAGTGAIYGGAETDGGVGKRALGAAGGAAAALGTAGVLGTTGLVGGVVGGKVARVTGLDQWARGVGQSVADASGGVLLPRLASNAAPAADTATVAAAQSYLNKLVVANGTTPADMVASAQPGMTAAEAIGPNAVTSAASLARQTGTTGKAANDLFLPRQAARADRLMGQIGQIAGVHPAAARGDLEGMIAARKAAVDPQYAALRADDAPI